MPWAKETIYSRARSRVIDSDRTCQGSCPSCKKITKQVIYVADTKSLIILKKGCGEDNNGWQCFAQSANYDTEILAFNEQVS